MIPPSEIRKNPIRNLFQLAFSLVNRTEELGNTVPKGEIFLNFYADSLPIPDEESFDLDEKGKIISPGQRNLERVIERNLVSGLVLSKESAQEICNWLQAMLGSVEGKK